VTYCVGPKLVAGRYPNLDEVRALVDAGVRTFVDLTEADELTPYAGWLPPDATHHRVAIRDFACPTADQVREVLAILRGDGIAYVHCRGGYGRTGVILGCYLIEAGLTPDAALERLSELTGKACPETPAQIEMVRTWNG
jgi:hypothetical protein